MNGSTANCLLQQASTFLLSLPVFYIYKSFFGVAFLLLFSQESLILHVLEMYSFKNYPFKWLLSINPFGTV